MYDTSVLVPLSSSDPTGPGLCRMTDKGVHEEGLLAARRVGWKKMLIVEAGSKRQNAWVMVGRSRSRVKEKGRA
jgi:hypothetical protein